MGPASQLPSEVSSSHRHSAGQLPPLFMQQASQQGMQQELPASHPAEDMPSELSSESSPQESDQQQPSSRLDSGSNGSEDMDAEDASASPLHTHHAPGFVDIHGSDDYDSDEGDYHTLGYCRNCTNTLFEPICAACGHHMDDDAQLFDTQPEPDLGEQASHQPSTSGRVALLWDERMEEHEEGRASPHPERPDRIRAVMARLQASGLTGQCVRVNCPEATLEQLAAVHTADLMEFVKAMAEGTPIPDSYQGRALTSDTYINCSTYSCARLAAGGSAAVAAMVARGEAAGGAAIVRPPGHHAESNMAMGFCFFNNAAVAARAAQAAGANRVLILDWDCHHGNGTQHIFESDPSVMYMSLHRWDHGTFYPGTGSPAEVGEGVGTGYTVNVAWNGGNLQNADYMAAFDRVLLPIARAYRPDLILVSAGFDAADGDPIGGCRVTPEGFAHMTAVLKAVAPIVLLLEGGYNLAATAASTEACLRVLMGQQPPPLPGPSTPSRAGALGIHAALSVQRRYWPCLQAAYQDSVQHLLQAAGPGMHAVGLGSALHMRSSQGLSSARAAAISGSTRGMHGVPLLVSSRATVSSVSPRKSPHLQQGLSGHQQIVGRKRQLLQQIRKRAQQAWWRRHQRMVRARAASQSTTPEPHGHRSAGLTEPGGV